MNVIKTLIYALCIGYGVNSAAFAGDIPSESRGELLYSTYCNACHTVEIHWKSKSLATNWPSLKAQVYRWQAYLGLSWDENDIIAATHYLNNYFYHFSKTEPKEFSQNKELDQVIP